MIATVIGLNYDYAIASIPIIIILLIFFSTRKNLPIRRTYLFLFLVFNELFLNIFDILSCELSEHWHDFPFALVEFSNITYYVLFATLSFSMFEYTYETINAPTVISPKLHSALHIPCIFLIILSITNPFTHFIYYFSDKGFTNGKYCELTYIIFWFYLLASVALIGHCYLHMSRRDLYSTLLFNLIIAIAILPQHSIKKTIITSYIFTLAILIIYVSSQNPDLFIDRRTRLFNKDGLEIIISQYIREKKPFECFCVCIQNYNTINSMYNTKQTDNTLLTMSNWLFNLIDIKHSILFYVGNGRFIILNTDKEHSLINYNKKIIDRFKEPIITNNSEVSLTIGRAFLPINVPKISYPTVLESLKIGSKECVKPHMNGDHLFIIDDEIMQQIKREDEVAKAVGRAIKNKTLMIYLQPLYSSSQNRITAAEALARLYDEQLGFIPPNEFISVAEKNGSIMEVGRQIFEQTCKFISENDLNSLGIDFINVNLSPAQCMNSHLADELMDIINKYNISTEQINLEITESVIDDVSIIRSQMQQLNKAGIFFSMDDFGTGTSNITRLLELPFNIVKLDMTVVWSYFKGTSTILKSQIQMFLNEQMDIVAEGVEDEHMAKTLVDLGCEYEQGFYYSKPLPTDQFIAYVKENNMSH